MPWIKKNLTLVLGGLVGLVLLGGSAFFLFSEVQREASINSQLEESRAEWTRLNNLNPFPDEKNIRTIKDEAARLEVLSGKLRGAFPPIEVPPVQDTFSLRLLVETTISSLTREAEAAGVTLPDRYAFTFQRLRDLPGQFDSNGIPRLAEQVAQISQICRVLYDAKIHSLDTLRRPPVLKEEGSGADYLTKKGATNQWVIRTPYDLSFRAFSSELAEVIRGLAALDQCVVIKTINIEPTSLPRSDSPGMMPGPMPMMMPQPGMAPTPGLPGGPGGMDPALRQRYGIGAAGRGENAGGAAGMDPSLRSRYGIGPGGGAAGMDPSLRSRYGIGPGAGAQPPPTLSQPGMPMAPAAPSGPSVVLDEKPLRVILQLDYIKTRPVAEAGARRAPRAPAADAGADADASAGGDEASSATE